MMMISLGLTRRACRWTRHDPLTPFWCIHFPCNLIYACFTERSRCMYVFNSIPKFHGRSSRISSPINGYDGGRSDTMPACSTSGTYTTHINGANHTPSTSQCHTACRTSSHTVSHPSASATYTLYAESRTGRKEDADAARESGTPSRTARKAAREKLTTEVMETMVLAKQRRRDLSKVGSGARLEGSDVGKSRAATGRRAVKNITGKVSVCKHTGCSVNVIDSSRAV